VFANCFYEQIGTKDEPQLVLALMLLNDVKPISLDGLYAYGGLGGRRVSGLHGRHHGFEGIEQFWILNYQPTRSLRTSACVFMDGLDFIRAIRRTIQE
jgi:hypothetical protein